MIKLFLALALFCQMLTKDILVYKNFISGDGFKALTPHQIDMSASKTYKFSNLNPKLVRSGDIVFIKCDRIDGFVRSYKNFRRVMEPFIIVTHNSAMSMPGKYAHLLDDPKVIAWFTSNPDIKHPKLIAIPSGLSNLSLEENKDNENTIKQIQSQLIGKTNLLYLNFDCSANPKRRAVLEKFKDKPFAKYSERKNFTDYMKDIAESDFVLSPAGSKLDSHRTWEALYMGAIPIVLTSKLDPMFEDLPVLIVDSWDQITEDFLINTREAFSKKKFNMEKLNINYWKNLIQNFR